MKDRIRFRFTQLTLVCLMILSSLGSPAALNAQIPDTPDAPPKVYLPLISIGGEPDLAADEDVIPGQLLSTSPACFPEYPNLPMILGSEGNDLNLRGTANGERICGLGGDDRIYGAKGNDFLQGNTGNDIVNGEVGDDFLRGGQNKDELNGGDGNDTLYGDLGDDTLNGNIGNDYVAGGEGNDTVRGGQNDDTVLGDAGNDTIYGDNGNDKLWGGAGTDTFIYMAGNGNDEIHDFEWSGDSLQLDGVTIQSYTQLGLAACRKRGGLGQIYVMNMLVFR